MNGQKTFTTRKKVGHTSAMLDEHLCSRRKILLDISIRITLQRAVSGYYGTRVPNPDTREMRTVTRNHYDISATQSKLPVIAGMAYNTMYNVGEGSTNRGAQRTAQTKSPLTKGPLPIRPSNGLQPCRPLRTV